MFWGTSGDAALRGGGGSAPQLMTTGMVASGPASTAKRTLAGGCVERGTAVGECRGCGTVMGVCGDVG